MLHILFNSPFTIDTKTMSLMLFPKDHVIALQNGVFIIFKKKYIKNNFLNKSINVYLLKEDVIERRIINYVSHHFHLIDYFEYIQLTQKYSKYINW